MTNKIAHILIKNTTNKEYLKKNYPVINTNNQGQKIYNPDFKIYFDKLNPQNYLDLAKKLAQEKSTIFRHIYLEDKQNNYTDIMQNGALSCAVFVSQVLLYFGLINTSNANVLSLEKNITKNGRNKVDFDEHKNNITEIPKGAIILRANQLKSKSNKTEDFFISDYHIGFYSGNKKAISNVVKDKNKNIKSIAEHNAIRDAPKLDQYDKIEIIRYYILNN